MFWLRFLVILRRVWRWVERTPQGRLFVVFLLTILCLDIKYWHDDYELKKKVLASGESCYYHGLSVDLNDYMNPRYHIMQYPSSVWDDSSWVVYYR